MKTFNILSGLACTGFVVASSRPSSVSICDYYTGALLKKDSEANQELLLTLLVNTAVIGNYTQPNYNYVPGILTPGTYNGENVNLLQYFDGELASTNQGGKCGVVVNFLDGGGAAPLMQNKPADCRNCNQ
jgi:hypothetical protein